MPDPILQSLAGLAASAQFYIVQGSEALEDGHFDAAASSFQRALEIDPENFTARKGMGYTLEKLGDVSGAQEQLRVALEGARDRDERAEAEAILGSLLAATGHDEEAVQHLTTSLQTTPDQPGTRLKLADSLARLGRMEEAVRHYDRLLAADPEHAAPLLVRRAAARINLGQTAGALADYRRAVEILPDDAGLRLRYAEALDFLGRPGDAEAQRKRARELSSQGEARVARLAGEGRLRAGRGDYEGAVESYRQAVELDPARHDVRTALASVLGHLGRYDEALAEYRKVIEAAPDHAPARRGEIAALLLSTRYGLARVRLNEAMSRFTRDKGLALTQSRLLAASPDPRVRDGALALQVAQRVYRSDQSLPVGDTLALALAAAGRVQEAAELQRGLVAQAEEAGQSELAAQLRDRLAAYEAGRAWVAPGPEPILEFVGVS
jgi:tetratricopeptide (TPR) repeat protein